MYKHFFKRFFDIIFSLIAILLLMPLYIILFLLVIIFMGRPVFFKQERIGKNEKSFNLYKFRTMTNKKDKDGNLLPEKNRLTKFGKFLRNTSLDEIPELFLILIGKMSIVGPRPQPMYYLDYYYPKEKCIFSVKGGLIPPGCLTGNYNNSWEDQIKVEMEYANNISLKLDIKIIFLTIKILFKRFKNDYGSDSRPHLNEYRKNDFLIKKKEKDNI